MEDPLDARRPGPVRRRRVVLLVVAGLSIATVVAALALFQPWKLWIDDTVDDAAPADAVVITAPADDAPPTTPPPSRSPTTAPQRSVETPPTTIAAAPTVTSAPSPPAPVTTAPAPIPLGGSFVGLDHDTTGSVALLQDPSGTRFARIEDLDTSNGPDLFVYLSTNPPDGPEGQFDDDIVDLGPLQGNIGSSNYAIPAGTDITRYATIVIWCDRFDSAFGAAPLN